MTRIAMMYALLERSRATMKAVERPGKIDLTKAPGVLPPKREGASKPRLGIVQRNGKV